MNYKNIALKVCQTVNKQRFSLKELHPTIEDIYVANVESDKGTREKIRFYDTAGIEFSQISTANGMTNQQLPRHYLLLADGYIMVYDTSKSASLDVLISIKKDIDKNKDKKEVSVLRSIQIFDFIFLSF